MIIRRLVGDSPNPAPKSGWKKGTERVRWNRCFESEVKLLQEDYNVLNTYNGKAPENCPERYRCYFEEDKVRTSSGGDVDEEMIREAREEERRVVAERLKKREARTRGQYRNNK